jgi:hypothetical protein
MCETVNEYTLNHDLFLKHEQIKLKILLKMALNTINQPNHDVEIIINFTVSAGGKRPIG